MDKFKEKLVCQCGPGGLKCPCCNPYWPSRKNKDKKKLDRIARHRLKHDDAKELLTTED